MARTKIPVEFSSTPGIVDNSTVTAITIDSVGSATFSGAVTADGLTTNTAKLKAIAKDISDTAVDVFVYDTRKDSDGGAWRNRTQGTSWYNETLNTSTRGARKEFPSVAVIVAEAAKITIYDGDDPDMPMWMVFANSSGDVYMRQLNTSSIVMLNSQMVWGDASYDVFSVRFVDEQYWMKNNGTTYENGYSGSIVKRNIAGALIAIDSLGIVNRAVNDVAMTVLPNAPIDADTGLPVPTIAVATDGGVSVIKDDGSVVDITHTASTNNNAKDIEFSGNKLIYTTQQSGSSTNYWRLKFIDIPSSDTTAAYASNLSGYQFDARGTTGFAPALNTDADLNDANNNIIAFASDKAVGFGNKLTLLNDVATINATAIGSVYVNAATAYVTTDYNTGWMHGNIKLATLSDTDTTNAVGTEYISNTSFTGTGNLTGWSLGGGGTAVNNNGVDIFDVTAAVSDNNLISTNVNLVSGTTYILKYTIVDNGAAVAHNIFVNGISPLSYSTANGTRQYSFVATQTSNTIQIRTGSGSLRLKGDNVSVRLAEEDHSVNSNGVEVFGTITKTPVATGADLVGYSGFSAGNYLAQPYNSDLAYGTGDFCYTLWIKKTGAAFGYIFDRANGDGTQRVTSYFNNGATISSYTNNGAINDVAIPNGSWFQLVQLRVNGTMKVYINGVLKGSVGTSTNLSGDSNVPLKIGVRFNLVDGLTDGSISLFRSSATAPTAEQITKMYNDEKFLFQENAKATLYGTSDAVTALAYDEDTELLHVGTSAGRSVFQGLNRVDNTTDAVGTAISASNGLVAED